MQSVWIPLALTTFAYFIVRPTHCLSINDLANIENGKYNRDANDEPETPTDLRNLLLKKLRFREILKEAPYSQRAFGMTDFDDDSSENHKASKRRNMDDILTRVRDLLTTMKEREAKESMSLPTLRFGRSGLNIRRAAQ